MKTKDELKALQAKTMAELDTDLKDKKSELFNLRFQLATGQLPAAEHRRHPRLQEEHREGEDRHPSARAGRQGITRKEATENG